MLELAKYGIDEYTKLYLPFTGANNSTTFTDYSFQNQTCTASGNAKIVTDPTGKFDVVASFDGTNSYVSPVDSSVWAFGSSNFVIEGMVLFTAAASNEGGIWSQYVDANNYVSLHHNSNSLIFKVRGSSSTLADYSCAFTPVANSWYHMAAVRVGTAMKLYINGILQSMTESTAFSTNAVPDLAAAPKIGKDEVNTVWFNGFLKNLRISGGTDRGYTGNVIQVDRPNPHTVLPRGLTSFTKLLIPGYGVNNSTDIRDYSGTGKTITVNGNAKISTGASKFNGSSIYFDGSNSCLYTPDSADFALGASNWTCEFWANVTNTSTDGTIISQWKAGGPDWNAQSSFTIIYASSLGGFAALVYSGTNEYIVWTSNYAISSGTWYHVAVARSGNSYRGYVDGIQRGSTVTQAATINDVTTDLNIGCRFLENTRNHFFGGYIQDLRFYVGTDLGYTGTTIAVPTAPSIDLTNDIAQYTKLLIKGQGANDSTQIYDSSLYKKAVTVNGGAKISTTQSKWAEYGSSLYFDGVAGTYLSITGAALSDLFLQDASSFYISFWLNKANNDDKGLIGTGGGHGGWRSSDGHIWILLQYSNYLYFQYFNGTGASSIISTSTVDLTGWNHIAVVKSGSTLSTYKNGSRLVQGTISSWTTVSSPLRFTVGQTAALDSGNYLNGYISDLQIVNGSSLGYTGSETTIPVPAFPASLNTVPQSQFYVDPKLVSDLNLRKKCVLDIRGRDPVIRDESIYQKDITNNNVTLSNTQSKYYGKSLYFDGNDGTLLNISNNTTFQWDTDNFTWEFWTCFTSFKSMYNMWIIQNGDGVHYNQFWYGHNDHKIYFQNDTLGENKTINWSPSLNTWYHIAFTRNNNIFNVYVNGLSLGSFFTSTNNFNVSAGIRIGYDGYSGRAFNGYLSNIKLYKGTCVYTTNFDVPSRPADLVEYVQTPVLPVLNITGDGKGPDDYVKLLLPGNNNARDFSKYDNTVTNTNVSFSSSIYKWPHYGYAYSFNGSNSTLSPAASINYDFAGNDFVIQLWYYPTETRKQGLICGDTDYRIGILFSLTTANCVGVCASSNGSSWNLFNPDGGGAGEGTTAPLSLNAWHHIAFVRTGTNWKTYLDGTRNINITVSGSVVTRNSEALRIGSWGASGDRMWNSGYISDLSIHIGTDLGYTGTSITVPKKPASRYLPKDSSISKKAVTLVGPPKILSTNQIIGDGAFYFNGSTDYISLADSADWHFGASDFRISFWWCPSSLSASQFFFAQHKTTWSGSAYDMAIQIRWSTTNAIQFYYTTDGTGNTEINSLACSFTPVVGTWYHIVLGRLRSEAFCFVNGAKLTNTGSGFSTNSIWNSGEPLYVGTSWSSGSLYQPLKGYLRDVTIFKGTTLDYTGVETTLPVPVTARQYLPGDLRRSR